MGGSSMLDPMMFSNWYHLLYQFLQTDKWRLLEEFIEYKYKHAEIVPEQKDLFRVLHLIKPEEVKCIIVGQDPYVQNGVPNGIAFDTGSLTIPDSLRNILKEVIRAEDSKTIPEELHINKAVIREWIKQGVLVINTYWTAEQNLSLSHKDIVVNGQKASWLDFTLSVINIACSFTDGLPIVLLGGEAGLLTEWLDTNNYLIRTTHPTTRSCYNKTKNMEAFMGSNFTGRINEYLKKQGKAIIKWI